MSQKNYQKSVREDIQGYYFKGFNSFRKTVENTKKGVLGKQIMQRKLILNLLSINLAV